MTFIQAKAGPHFLISDFVSPDKSPSRINTSLVLYMYGKGVNQELTNLSGLEANRMDKF